MLVLLVLVFIINIPFGYWRSGVRKFSRGWFLFVHGSIPFVITLRILSGIHWTIMVGALLASSFFVGQTVGARLRA